MSENIDHPPHYGGDTQHEVIKCLKAWGLELDALLWNTVKYIARSGKKNACLEDLKKARWYLDRRISSLQQGSTPAESTAPESWRTGSRVPLNVYDGNGIPVCQCHDEDDAQLIVTAVNVYTRSTRDAKTEPSEDANKKEDQR